ncbi:MAG: hypothetical protein KDN05_06195 [Verrucomicrobiae bacterium]|nr:hypothetical protein [Verrucomicrobiae bacterium]
MKRRRQPEGTGRILDAWTPPEDAGDAIGLIATTFTFKPDFFQQDCLDRFLGLQTDPDEDGPAYLIEREEKLAQLRAAIVLVDQHHARDILRHARWDLLVARPARGIFHAKISLLLWTRRARLIIASANLTEDGCRRNLETYGVLDYHDEGTAPLPVLDETLAFLREAALTSGSPGVVSARWSGFLDQVRTVTREWGMETPPRGQSEPRIHAVLSGPGRPSVFDSLAQIKPASAFSDAFVLSPFFDPPQASNAPAHEIWNLLRQRGAAAVEYHVIAEEVPGEDRLLVRAPAGLLEVKPDATSIHRVDLDSTRPLHAKCLSFESDSHILRLIGSSNFTSAGLGLGAVQNWEANLAYVADRQRHRSAARALDATWPDVKDFPSDQTLQYLPLPDDENDAADTLPLLPAAFGEAIFAIGSRGPEVRLQIHSVPPGGWALLHEDDSIFFRSVESLQFEGDRTLLAPWTKDRPPCGFRVVWDGSKGAAWWPVNVLDAATLPPPDELKDLPLEVLMDIFSTTRSLHECLKRWLEKNKRETGETDPASQIDPHKKVNTASFLLQRARRVSAALRGLRQRLERPVPSDAALHWRLRGPVGVEALARAIAAEARSEVERCFLCIELCLELRRVRPSNAPGCLPAPKVRRALNELAAELSAGIPSEALAQDPALSSYTNAALRELTA